MTDVHLVCFNLSFKSGTATQAPWLIYPHWPGSGTCPTHCVPGREARRVDRDLQINAYGIYD
jgi:hypothetical protein